MYNHVCQVIVNQRLKTVGMMCSSVDIAQLCLLPVANSSRVFLNSKIAVMAPYLIRFIMSEATKFVLRPGRE